MTDPAALGHGGRIGHRYSAGGKIRGIREPSLGAGVPAGGFTHGATPPSNPLDPHDHIPGFVQEGDRAILLLGLDEPPENHRQPALPILQAVDTLPDTPERPVKAKDKHHFELPLAGVPREILIRWSRGLEALLDGRARGGERFGFHQ